VFEDDFLTVACQWANTDEEDLTGYVNGLCTPEGGTHVQGFNDALVSAFNSVSKKKLKLADLKPGLLGFVNVKLSKAAYGSQTKEKLKSPITKEVCSALEPKLKEWLSGNQRMVKNIYKRAILLREARAQSSQLMKAAASLKDKTRKGVLLPGILVMSDPKTPAHKKELFLVEGDSAGGPCKDARDYKFQEVLPLSGKPLNAARKSLARTLASEPIQNILTGLGVDPKHFKTLDPKNIRFRVGRLMLLTDADSDGFHISNLILTALYKLVPVVFELGMVFIVDAPLYFASHKDRKYYGRSLRDIQEKAPKGALITRAKGWGEVPVSMLDEVAFNPATRKLIKVLPISGKDGVKFIKIVGDETKTRKEILGIADHR